jgi:hypothetical protein
LQRAISPLDAEAARVFSSELERAQRSEDPPTHHRHPMPVSKTNAFLFASRAYENATRAMAILPQSLIVAMVSQHDAFTGRLIRALFSLKPELLKAVKRTLEVADLEDLPDVDAVRNMLVEDQIRAVLRESHRKQLTWLEDLLKMTLSTDESLLQRFGEVTQRRHLYAHNGGVITNQYLAARQNVDPRFSGRVGDVLELTDEDFERAHTVLFEIAVKLSQVAWRKIRPDQLDEAEEALSRLGYMLLAFEDFGLARCVLEFATEQPKFVREQTRRKDLINLAQAYKWDGDETRCEKILEKDWSACDDSFQLAVAVLQERYEDSRRLMLTAGRNGDILERGFRDWPLFRRFRQRPEYQSAFHELYGRGPDEERPVDTPALVGTPR